MRLWTLTTQNVVHSPVYQAYLGTGKIHRFLTSIPELLNQSLHFSRYLSDLYVLHNLGNPGVLVPSVLT